MKKLEYATSPAEPLPDNLPGAISRWSPTLLKTWEACPKQALYRHKRVKTDIPKSEAAERGIRTHAKIEEIWEGKADWSDLEIKSDPEQWRTLQEGFNGPGMVRHCELRLSCTSEWERTGWKSPDAWLVGIADLVVIDLERPLEVVVADFKTGRRWGNEMAHMTQVMTYASMMLTDMPHVQDWVLQIWYLDDGSLLDRTLSTEAVEAFRRNLTAKGMELTSAYAFPANPTKQKCRWCDWRLQCDESAYPKE